MPGTPVSLMRPPGPGVHPRAWLGHDGCGGEPAPSPPRHPRNPPNLTASASALRKQKGPRVQDIGSPHSGQGTQERGFTVPHPALSLDRLAPEARFSGVPRCRVGVLFRRAALPRRFGAGGGQLSRSSTSRRRSWLARFTGPHLAGGNDRRPPSVVGRSLAWAPTRRPGRGSGLRAEDGCQRPGRPLAWGPSELPTVRTHDRQRPAGSWIRRPGRQPGSPPTGIPHRRSQRHGTCSRLKLDRWARGEATLRPPAVLSPRPARARRCRPWGAAAQK